MHVETETDPNAVTLSSIAPGDPLDVSRMITQALTDSGRLFQTCTLSARRPYQGLGSLPVEILRYQLDGDREQELFCKYDAEYDRSDFSHRGGVRYEAAVYRQVLTPLSASTARCYGDYVDPLSGRAVLVLEYMTDAEQITETVNAWDDIVAAAAWIGAVQRSGEHWFGDRYPEFLHAYDAAYFLGWSERTDVLAGAWHHTFPWLHTVCVAFAHRVVPLLLAAPQSFIHGEYCPKNILVRNRQICPVDWETAAIGAGEIDLAGLTDRWPLESVRACEEAYAQARWPQRKSTGMAARLLAARIYLHLRWLGDPSAIKSPRDRRQRFEQLHHDATALGLL
jgi:hypothetical protein